MTLTAFRYRGSRVAVMAFAARASGIHGVHGHLAAAFLHQEKLIMTISAAK